ncbi:MAG: hypothetical protein HC850_16005 [Rhodomicrobium sp.]|nr:hypothetical protein [Rhodomicrobium sp.]
MFAALGSDAAPRTPSAIQRLAAAADEQVAFFESFNDPKGVYARCLACDGK